jgi:hypothetical protein
MATLLTPRGFRVFWLGLCAMATSSVSAQEESPPPGTPPFQSYLDLVESKYLPPAQAGGKQAIQLKVDVSPDIPVGAKLRLALYYNAVPVEDMEMEYELKDRKRQGIVINWSPKKPLSVDTYQLEVQMPLGIQTPAVQAELKKIPKRFPPRFDPWVWTYLQEKEAIHVGTPEEAEAQKKKICKTYEDFINRLADNLGEFTQTIEDVRAKKKFFKGDAVDKDALTDFVKVWRKKQGKVQFDIRELLAEERAIVAKTDKAYRILVQLAQMVSKRSVQLQDGLTKELGLGVINPKPSAKVEDDKLLASFDSRYRFAATQEELNKQVDQILDITCPDSRRAEGAEAEGEKKDPKSEPGKEPAKENSKAEPSK